MLTLNEGQEKARAEILAACEPAGRHLLQGPAGTGKTTLLQVVARDLAEKSTQYPKIALTAPTHKAVAVLSARARKAGLEKVECCTIHSLLSLEPKVGRDGTTHLQRRKGAEPVKANIVVIDECSMVDQSLFKYIRTVLRDQFVLYVGDKAQLPPVNENDSPSFDMNSASHLNSIVRQEADNPVLAAATVIRQSQGGPADWSWCQPAKLPPKGVYAPGQDIDRWLRKAFTSPDFEADNDRFRYLAWTNDRVAEINARIRKWRHGDTCLPFCPGEKALLRAPIMRKGHVVFGTNEEVDVRSCRAIVYNYDVRDRRDLPAWRASLPCWEIVVTDGRISATVFLPRDKAALHSINQRFVAEAGLNWQRWIDLAKFRESIAKMQHIYAMTVHTSQGSTFSNVFVDVPDIKHREQDNLLEMQKLLYVACTRPTTGLFLAGV